jgi:hypothetical protein
VWIPGIAVACDSPAGNSGENSHFLGALNREDIPWSSI